VVDAFYVEVVIARPLATDGWAFANAEPAATGNPRAQQRKVHHTECERARWQVQCLTVSKCGTDLRRGRIDQGGRLDDFHLSHYGPDLQHPIRSGRLVDID